MKATEAKWEEIEDLKKEMDQIKRSFNYEKTPENIHSVIGQIRETKRENGCYTFKSSVFLAHLLNLINLDQETLFKLMEGAQWFQTKEDHKKCVIKQIKDLLKDF
jgi:hypothetical protein